jgi:hypothetical protein
LEELLEHQQAEVRASKIAIEALHKENNRLEKTRKLTEKQWEESLTAMSGRDKAIQNMADHKQSILTKLSESELVNRVCTTELADLQKQFRRKEQELEELHRAHSQIQTELRDVLSIQKDDKLSLNKSHFAEASLSKDLKDLINTAKV